VALWHRARSPLAAWVALALVAANPLTLRALEIGHPEELLGGALCVAAALAAGRDRSTLAGVLLGLAIANKAWAMLAVVPLLAILSGGRVRFLMAAGGAAALVMAPLALAGGAVAEGAAVARTSGDIFQPWQIWWFLGESGHVVVGTLGEKPGYRVGPEWLTGVAHPLVVLIPAAISVALLPKLRNRPWHDGLLLMAFALLLRCLLDPWNVSYYSLPFLLALVAWEVHADRRPPVLSVAATFLAWLTLVWLTTRVHPDVQAVAYLAWSVPLAALMGARLFGLGQGAAAPAVAPRAV
jgi:Glycosyltransferase family 87